MDNNNMDTEPLQNPRHEVYCQQRLLGKSQRQAMLVAYPTRKKWAESAQDRAAYGLEHHSQIAARLAALKNKAAQAVILSRADILRGMGDTFTKASELIGSGTLTQTTVSAISSIGRTLLDAIPENAAASADGAVHDFGLLLAPPFMAMHRAIARDAGGTWWLKGGRYSGKSSSISLEIVKGLMQHPERSAFVMPKIGKDVGEGVFEQMLWALDKLGALDQWRANKSPYKLTRSSTGQVITFRGGDHTQKTKAIKAPSGTYYAYQWLSEVDQFRGMHEIRTVLQSITRDAPQGAVYFRFFDYNPPRSRDAWVNRYILDIMKDKKQDIVVSSYLDMPYEWVPEQVREDAVTLQRIDEEAYRHEYLGEPVGYGSEVFSRVEVREIPEEERATLEYRYYGVDWGFSVDPFVWVQIAYDQKTRVLYVLDEIVGLKLSNSEAAERVREKMRDEPYAPVWCDSAEPKSISDFRELGIAAKACSKSGAHSIRSSVKWLQQRVKIVVDPRCTYAAREFSTYSYELTRDGEPTGALPDKDNHSIDAVRYACTTLINDRRCT